MPAELGEKGTSYICFISFTAEMVSVVLHFALFSKWISYLWSAFFKIIGMMCHFTFLSCRKAQLFSPAIFLMHSISLLT